MRRHREDKVLRDLDRAAREDAFRDIGDRDTEPPPAPDDPMRPVVAFPGAFFDMHNDSNLQVSLMRRLRTAEW